MKRSTINAIIALSDALNIPEDDCWTIRRIAMTLHRWAELECGRDNGHASYAIERDEATGKPRMHVHPYAGKPRSYAIPDREAGALKRLAKICAAHGLHYYHQTDPRGSSVYLSRQPLTDTDYNRGHAVPMR